MGRYDDNYWPPYVPVAERRRRAAREAAEMKKAGRSLSPVTIAGRKITATFWGDAWCKNLEAYSDFSNRLPRGRSYLRHGSVIDLRIEAGHVRALVSGSDLYAVDIKIKPLDKRKWAEIKDKCAGQIGSLVELLQGSLSDSVMEVVTRKEEGLFPSPREITLSCSCPDWAGMCKHVAATLYGAGARLDREPGLLFTLRGVDPAELVEAAIDQPAGAGKAGKGRVLETDELSSVFGVDINMDGMSSVDAPAATRTVKKKRRATKARKPAAAGPGTKKRATKKKAAAKKPTTKKATKKARGKAGKAVGKKAAARRSRAGQAAPASNPSSRTPSSKKAAVRKTTRKAARKTTKNTRS